METLTAAQTDVIPAVAALPASGRRIISLDQFRGYTVAGMFVVNFLGGFAVTPAVLRHHNSYCSYADTIMPQFLFAVGFAFRLTFGRRARAEGLPAAYRRVARRLGGLVLLSLVFYTLAPGPEGWQRLIEQGPWAALAQLGKRDWFQTLLHIAVTSLWILPVIRASVVVRVAYLILSAAAHVALSAWFNFTWVNTPPHGIDGGPFGFLTWSIPALVGTLACDALVGSTRPHVGKMLAWSLVLMALGYGLSCPTRLYDVPGESAIAPVKLAESPFVPPLESTSGRDVIEFLAEPPFIPPPAGREWNYWMMSQRSGSVSYQVFAAGLSLAVFVLFHLACDRLGWRLGLFRTLGTNALAAYVLGGAVEAAVKQIVPRDAPLLIVAAGFTLFFSCAYLLVRLLEWRGLLLRL
jgi:hypothetical protein